MKNRSEIGSARRMPLAELPGRFAHATDPKSAEAIMRRGPKLPRRSRRPCPHEGLAFAVSLDPEAWMAIAETGPAIIVVDFDEPALDFHRWRAGRRLEEILEVREFGTAERLITTVQTFLVWFLNEFDEESYFEFEEGSRDLEYYREQLALGKEADDPVLRIEPARGWRFLPRIQERMAAHYVGGHQLCLEFEVVNMWLAEAHPEIGMVWYEERKAPFELSAPRGAILPAYFGAVRPVEATDLAGWYARYAEEAE